MPIFCIIMQAGHGPIVQKATATGDRCAMRQLFARCRRAEHHPACPEPQRGRHGAAVWICDICTYSVSIETVEPPLPGRVSQTMRNYAPVILVCYQREGDNGADTMTNTAASLINDLVEHGVLGEMRGGRRNRLFRFRDFLGLFRK